VFGDDAYKSRSALPNHDRPLVSGAGGIEMQLARSLSAIPLFHQTINLENPGKECDWIHAERRREKKVRVALK